jgi:hypothetical protein
LETLWKELSVYGGFDVSFSHDSTFVSALQEREKEEEEAIVQDDEPVVSLHYMSSFSCNNFSLVVNLCIANNCYVHLICILMFYCNFTPAFSV